MKRLIEQAWKRESGAAMALVASMLVVLMGVAALSADVAWFYLNASRIQRSADAAALGGVVWLPAAVGTANGTAFDIAFRNGYDDADPDITVTSGVVAGEPNQLEVEIRAIVPTFFGKVIGFDTMAISRRAVAEFIPPLKLGSPANQFGNNCNPTQPGCPAQTANFWANIHGWYTIRSMGDANASHCTSQADNPGCPTNPFARDTGYLYGIESGSSFTVEGLDLAFHNTSGGSPTGDPIRTGDRGCEDWGPSTASDCGPTMVVTLYAPDPTPLDVSDNAVLCTATIPPQPQAPAAGAYNWVTPDGQSCWTQSGTGIFVLQIRHLDPVGATDRAGLNRYSIRSSSGNLFAIGDFSIYNNTVGSLTQFYLAEVPSFYNGKTFVVELFDAGDADNGTLQLVDPSGGVFNGGECRLYTRPNPGATWTQTGTIPAGSPCEELVTSGEYNDRWLKFELDLPATYSCTTCWWKMNYVYSGNVQDTTTWRAYMIGNPIHIID